MRGRSSRTIEDLGRRVPRELDHRPISHPQVHGKAIVGVVQHRSFEAGRLPRIFETCPRHQLGQPLRWMTFRGRDPADIRSVVNWKLKRACGWLVPHIRDRSAEPRRSSRGRFQRGPTFRGLAQDCETSF